MPDAVFAVPIDFASHDGKTRIRAKIWTSSKFGDGKQPGTEKPKAVVQIVHGMAEYSPALEDEVPTSH